jgi:hypothetical protein
MSNLQKRSDAMAVEAIINGTGEVNRMIKGYLEAALWTEEMDDKSFYDIDPECLRLISADVINFHQENHTELMHGMSAGMSWEHAGHDIWMTRNGHGVGFWDGDWPEECEWKLTDNAREMGESYVYIGDDGKIYLQ